jgi:hypothetical protein
MLPIQRELAKTTWKEYFQEGRKYYYNVCSSFETSMSLLIFWSDCHEAIKMGHARRTVVTTGEGWKGGRALTNVCYL